MTIRLKLPNSSMCQDACYSLSELSQALKIQSVKFIGSDDTIMIVDLDVSAEISRAPILAMFAGLERYWLNRAALDEVARSER